jgi:hypothetical protein
MRTSRVFVLTIRLGTSAYESDRTLACTILRRRADGPLLVRDKEASDKAQHPDDRNILRYTSRQPYVQAIFVDYTALERAQGELRSYGLPTGVVSRERRRACRAELPCTCVLLDPWEARARSTTGTLFALYNRVATCPRHAQLVPRSRIRPLAPLVQQQMAALLADAPTTTRVGAPGAIDERASLPGRQSRNRNVEALLATVAARGRKIAMSG